MATTTKTQKPKAIKIPKITDQPQPGVSPNLAKTAQNSSLQLSKGQEFKAEVYAPSDLFQPSANIPAISETEHAVRVETVKGQQRAVQVVQENLKLYGSLLKAEGESINNLTFAEINAGKAVDLHTQKIKTDQSQAKLSIEQSKLAGLQHDVNGYKAEADLKGAVWATKIESLQTGLAEAQQRLQLQKQQLATQLKELG